MPNNLSFHVKKKSSTRHMKSSLHFSKISTYKYTKLAIAIILLKKNDL